MVYTGFLTVVIENVGKVKIDFETASLRTYFVQAYRELTENDIFEEKIEQKWKVK